MHLLLHFKEPVYVFGRGYLSSCYFYNVHHFYIDDEYFSFIVCGEDLLHKIPVEKLLFIKFIN